MMVVCIVCAYVFALKGKNRLGVTPMGKQESQTDSSYYLVAHSS